MIRSWIKTKAAGALSRTGMDRAVGSFAGWSRGAVVIGYHRVVEDFARSATTSIPAMLISTEMLERHLDWLGARFRFASLDEVGARLDGHDTSTDPIVAVTFDDGYRDFYDLALPLLKRKGVPATIFVVTGLVSTHNVQLHDKLYLLLARRAGQRSSEFGTFPCLLRSFGIPVATVEGVTPYRATRTLLEALPQESVQTVIQVLESEDTIAEETFVPFHSVSWEMLETIQRAGMTIGSHTKTHVLLTNESADRASQEASESRQEIEQRLGVTVRHFAYPSGQFDHAAVKAVAGAGYRFGYTVCSHRDAGHPRLTVPRTLLWENSCRDYRGAFSGPIMSCQIHRTFDVVSGCRQAHRTGQESGNVRR